MNFVKSRSRIKYSNTRSISMKQSIRRKLNCQSSIDNNLRIVKLMDYKIFTLSLHHALVLPCLSLISWLTLWPSQAAPIWGPKSVIGVSFWKLGTSRDAPWWTRVDIAVLFLAMIAQCKAVLPWRLSVSEWDAPRINSSRVGSKLKI